MTTDAGERLAAVAAHAELSMLAQRSAALLADAEDWLRELGIDPAAVSTG